MRRWRRFIPWPKRKPTPAVAGFPRLTLDEALERSQKFDTMREELRLAVMRRALARSNRDE